MRAINRSALVVRPREPYVAWAASLDSKASEQAAAICPTQVSVYLVPHDPKEEQECAPIRGFFKRIFEQELENWCTDPDLWPQDRSFKAFNTWFDVQPESLVWDIVDEPLLQEDW
jgi:hypothetical protein